MSIVYENGLAKPNCEASGVWGTGNAKDTSETGVACKREVTRRAIYRKARRLIRVSLPPAVVTVYDHNQI